MIKSFTPIIGLEIHVQLKTKSKMFCSCDAKYFGAEPNTHLCPICLALPGALPKPNKKALKSAIKVGIALNCEINKYSKFDRKNYMYPDLFKGYQITQYELPICGPGYVNITGKKVGITRAHQEEDTAKSMHENGYTLIDGNKAGVPLLEIVSDPDMSSANEAKQYAEHIYNTIRFIGVSDCDMEKGQLRFDVNINLSIEKELENGNVEKVATPIVEVKNLNSFRSMVAAIEYEIVRQKNEFEKTEIVHAKGSKITRGWSDDRGETYVLRTKEEAEDYRYFTDPDLVPVVFTDDQIQKLRDEIGELPEDIYTRYTSELKLDNDTSTFLSINRNAYKYFEAGIKIYNNPKRLADWIINTIIPWGVLEFDDNLKLKILNYLINTLKFLDENKLSSTSAIKLMSDVKSKLESNPDENIDLNTLAQNYFQVNNDDDILPIVEKILNTDDGKEAVEKYKAGKSSIIMYLVGMVMREMKGKGNPSIIKSIIESKLKE